MKQVKAGMAKVRGFSPLPQKQKRGEDEAPSDRGAVGTMRAT
jgi:hypothetical protein